MKHLLAAPLGALLLALAGCSSVQLTTSYPSANSKKIGDRPVASVVVENNGYYLFSFIPLFAGNPDRRHHTVFFRNTVTLENNVRMLEEEAERRGGVIIDEVVTVGGDYCIPYLAWLLSRRTLSTSANLYQYPDAPEAGASAVVAPSRSGPEP